MNARNLAFGAMLAALMAVCTWISVPMPGVPFTLQTFALFLALLLVGGRRGFLVVLAYLLMGGAGLPVFSGFRGGLSALTGPTGGYLMGFLVGAGAYWLLTAALGSAPKMQLAGLCLCLVCDYAVGTAWYARMYLGGGFWAAALQCVAPYMIPDLAKMALAWVLAKKLKRFV